MTQPETLTAYDEEGNEITIPSRFELCDRCHGTGSHVNPAVDGNGLSQEDFDEQGFEFFDDYMAGVYDITCLECQGQRLVTVPDENRATTEQLALYHKGQQELRDMYAEMEMERRMGA